MDRPDVAKANVTADAGRRASAASNSPQGATREELAYLDRWRVQRRHAKDAALRARRGRLLRGQLLTEGRRLLVALGRTSADAVRAHGDAVMRDHGVSRLRQFAASWWLNARYDVSPTAYYRFQLYRPERWRQRRLYGDEMHTARVLHSILRTTTRAQVGMLNDKRKFPAWCADIGLPSVGTIAEVTEAGREGGGAFLPHVDLFTKPVNWQGGRGARRWVAVAEARYRGDGGELVGATELVAQVARQSAEIGRPMLVQRLVRNHAALRTLTLGGLATVRLVTYRFPDADVAVLAGILRMPAGDSATDNFDGGGLAASIDLQSGRLRPAVKKAVAAAGQTFDAHPDTGETIVGREVPYWHDAVSLALRGHQALAGTIPLLGWDVAITEEGPVFVEANTAPCAVLLQMALGVPVGATPYTSCLVAYLRRAVPKR